MYRQTLYDAARYLYLALRSFDSVGLFLCGGGPSSAPPGTDTTLRVVYAYAYAYAYDYA